jgi:hypothetical protein
MPYHVKDKRQPVCANCKRPMIQWKTGNECPMIEVSAKQTFLIDFIIEMCSYWDEFEQQQTNYDFVRWFQSKFPEIPFIEFWIVIRRPDVRKRATVSGEC